MNMNMMDSNEPGRQLHSLCTSTLSPAGGSQTSTDPEQGMEKHKIKSHEKDGDSRGYRSTSLLHDHQINWVINT